MIAVMNIPTLFSDERWQGCLEDYCQHLFYEKSQSVKTLQSYTRGLAEFFSNRARPEYVTRRDVLAFIHRKNRGTRRPGEEPAIGTQRLRLTVLSSFFKYASSYTIAGPGGAPVRLFPGLSPTSGIAYAKLQQSYKAMSLDELKAFFAVIDRESISGSRDYALYLMYLVTLRRKSEIARLTWGDLSQGEVRDEAGVVRIAWTYSWHGKGDGPDLRRIIELPAPCVHALQHWLLVSERTNLAPDEPLFVPVGLGRWGPATNYVDTQRALSISTISYNFKAICQRAGLDPSKFSLHSLRHAGIQQRLLSGEEITDIMRISSHKSLDSFITYARQLSTADNGASLLASRFDFIQ